MLTYTSSKELGFALLKIPILSDFSRNLLWSLLIHWYDKTEEMLEEGWILQ